jgi:RNA polymerase-binding transcription factor DksA
MFHSMMNTLFGCGHQRTTFPITLRRSYLGSQVVSGLQSSTYVACLDCGKEIAYDWKAMRTVQTAALSKAERQTQASFR